MTDRAPGLARPILICLLSALLFGASTPVAKRLLDGAGPVTLAGLFYAGAALGVLPFSRGGDAALRRAPAQRKRVALTALLGGCVAPVLVLIALRQAPAASIALWLNLEAAATAALGVLVFGEHIGWRSWLAVSFTIAGGALLAAPSDAGAWTAAALVAGACVCWGVDNHLTSIIDGFTPPQGTLVKGLAAAATNVTAGLLLEGIPSARTIAAALALGALAYGASVVLYVRGAHALQPARSWPWRSSRSRPIGTSISTRTRPSRTTTSIATTMVITTTFMTTYRPRRATPTPTRTRRASTATGTTPTCTTATTTTTEESHEDCFDRDRVVR